ncbi:glycosyltransferase family 2 protein [Methanolobus vulcani]|uniref:Glycosyltransferase n=1 Tax=Methanolobus vulcani TaxID=38026 RepID=A0A7Z8KLR1_9EURY|nr:glycosyltransferase [Methanolobus vulcani]TQD23860.1 glycosyltransferase [Methanolobus vulcani]
MKLAPIALFVYNRPNHTHQTLENLIKAPEFKDSVLYIFCDGAKTEEDVSAVQNTRKLIHSYDLKNTIIIESENNKGLARSIVEGINYVLQKHDKIIVLEDDCVPTPDFLNFMNFCLSYYESDERIMNVSGYASPIEIPEDYPYDIYFSYRSSSWGWSTWKRAWAYYSNNPNILKMIESSSSIKKKLDRAGLDLYPMIKKQTSGKSDSWAVYWSINIILKDGLCIFPVKSRIRNIGNDGSGTHCSADKRYDVQINEQNTEQMSIPKIVIPDGRIVKACYNFYAGSMFKKTLYFCYHRFSKFIDLDSIICLQRLKLI